MRKMSLSTNVPSRIRFRLRADTRSWPKGFSTMTRAPLAHPDSSQLFHDGAEEGGRDCQVMRGVLCAAERASDRLEGRRVLVVAVNILKQSAQLVERLTDQSSAVLLDALLRARAQLIEGPAGLGYTDDRHVEVAALGHRLQRGKDLLVGQIARGSEEYERVGMCVAHLRPGLMRVLRGLSPRVRRTENASPKAACSGSPPRRAS